jgi:hypothetical protein
MYSMNYMLAKALETEHLREAKQDRLARQYLNYMKKMRTITKKRNK